MPYAVLLEAGSQLDRPTLDDLHALAVEAPRSAMLTGYGLDSLEPLAALGTLESLKINGLGKINSLTGLERLTALRQLVLAPPPGWDGSGRCIEVPSYQPLAALTRLERLVLLRVRPRDLDLAPIAGLQQLAEVNIAGVPEFTLEHYAGLAAALPNTTGRCLQPYVRIEGIGVCGRCRGRTVMLTGSPKRARQWLCPICNEKKLAEHVRRWEEAKAAASVKNRSTKDVR